MKRCVIIGGAEIKDYDMIRSYLRPEDDCFFCDSGLKHREGLGAAPTLVIGDFDSWEEPCEGQRIFVSEEQALSEHNRGSISVGINSPEVPDVIVLPHKKDDTDTVYAVKEGLRRGYEDFLLLGVTGQRLDHTLANVYALMMIFEQGKSAMIADDYSEMLIVGEKKELIEDRFPYFSLVSIAGTARGVQIDNALFSLTDGEIRSSYQYAVSNEVLPGMTASVSVREGVLLLIRNR